MKNQAIGTAVIILNQNNQLLLGLRKNAAKAGYYGLPGGRLKMKEKVIDGAHRELKEETNLNSKKLNLVCVVKEWLEDEKRDFVHFIFICKDWSGKLTLAEPDKCASWNWSDLNNLPTRIVPSHLKGINQIKKKIATIKFFDI